MTQVTENRELRTVKVQHNRSVVYVTLDAQDRLVRANLGGDYMDITEKLTGEDCIRLVRKAKKVVARG
jgi:hypothetical protein